MHWLARLAKDHPRASLPLLRGSLTPLIATAEALTGTIPPALVELSSVAGVRLYRPRKLGNGMDMVVPLNDLPGAAIAADGFYEPETVALVQKILRPGMVFFDVGAHCGQYTLLAAPLVGSSGEVHCFEPDPATHRCLSENIAINRLANVTANRLALADLDGETMFYESNADAAGTNSLRPSPYFSGKTYPVQVRRLSTYLAESGVSRIDVMKIDIEGAEYRLLSGSPEIFRGSDRPAIVIEVNPTAQMRLDGAVETAEDYLRDLGYELYRISDGSLYEPRSDDPSYFNVVAWPPERPRLF
jgi:FkbM family methyltransferase